MTRVAQLVNRERSPEKVFGAVGRKQYVNTEVVPTIPRQAVSFQHASQFPLHRREVANEMRQLVQQGWEDKEAGQTHQQSAHPEYKGHGQHSLQGTCFERAYEAIECARQDKGAQNDNEDGHQLADQPKCDPYENQGNDTLRRYFKAYEAGAPVWVLAGRS